MEELKVGDRIYSTHHGRTTGVYVIERVTKTQAISGNTRFKKEYRDGGFIKKIADDTWSSTFYSLETPEVKEKYKYQLALSKVKQIDFSKLTMEKITEILKIAEE